MRILVFVALVALLALGTEAIVVSTPFGFITGVVDSATGSSMFLGIPFATPPVGVLRYMPPQLVSPMKTINATAYAAACAQLDFLDPSKVMAGSSEDCLYLNVFVPPATAEAGSSSSLPVLVFIHGGAFQQGSAALYPGQSLAATTNSIVVTIQHRLSLFGFLTVSGQSTVNLGLYDQRVALQWIAKAIASFGGDPVRVVLFGQSSGAGSVALHLTSKQSWPYFSAAILESPGPIYLMSAELATARWDTVLTNVQGYCPSTATPLQCLQSLNTTQVLQLAPRGPLPSPVVDSPTGFIPDDPLRLWYTGAFRPNTTIMIGNTLNEGLFLAYQINNFNLNVTRSLYWQGAVYSMIISPAVAMRGWTSGPLNSTELDIAEGLAVQASSFYGISPNTNLTSDGWFDAVANITGDSSLVCVSTQIATYAAHAAPGRVFRYIWTHPVDWMFPFNVTHACELGYVFSSELVLGTRFLTAQDRQLANIVSNAWASLGRSLAPSVPNLTWPPYDADTKSVMQLDTPLALVNLGIESLPSMCIDGWNPIMLGDL